MYYMRRKIIKQGHNTLTVSLPRKWCTSHNLKEAEEIDVSEKSNCLILSKEAYKGTGSIVVDITNLDRSVMLLVEILYTYGYNLITLTTKSPKIKDIIHKKELSPLPYIHKILNRLIGAEIISSSSNKYTIQVITEDSREKFGVVLRRIFRLIIEMFDSFIEGMRKKDKEIVESIELQFINTRKFTNYALRLLNKFGHEEADKTTFYFSIINFLGKISNIIKNSALYTVREGKLNQSKQLCDLVEEITRHLNFIMNLSINMILKN